MHINKSKINEDTVFSNVCLTPPRHVSPFGWATTSGCCVTLCLLWDLHSSQAMTLPCRHFWHTRDREQWSLFWFEARANYTRVNPPACQVMSWHEGYDCWPLDLATPATTSTSASESKKVSQEDYMKWKIKPLSKALPSRLFVWQPVERVDSPLCARAIKLAEGIGVLSLVIHWISASADECWKTNRTELQPPRPLVPLARCDLYSDLSAER